MSDPSRVVVSGPLSTFAPGFLEELLRHGYRPGSVAKQLQLATADKKGLRVALEARLAQVGADGEVAAFGADDDDA